MNHFTLPTRAVRRLAVGSALGLGAATLAAGAASAHVTVTPSTTASGAYSLLTFSNPHGCDGSPTTKVSISIPDGIYAVTPTRHADYTIEKVMEPLADPVDDGHGGEYTERVSEVVYTATTPLPDGYRDAFELQLKLPEGEAGEQLAFPTIQTCETGETAWIDETVEGEPEPDAPAPAFTLTAATDDGHGHDHGSGDESDTAASAADESASGTGAVGWVALALGASGLLLGGAAFARSGSRS
ncbi:MAG: YcnI family protein [Aeromicrobium sp.]|uniref:YcnI family copper-binding membrane protein n=1 Tax=Aeromicrobium sp. TaxID=1871063 RepID=UPI0025C54E05|nr:YcnI family protein [Aeromicrobium sp.]MCK5890847.1 YcnI family protein [Aeromicrobium sp.]MDF1703180.1 YcnI family protein [Aeromicrobium sp.]